MSYKSIFRPGLFSGQVAVVTGGGSGIGRCTAHELSSLGATVALVGRDEARLAAVQAEIAQAGGEASSHACDIREEARVAATIEAILALHGRIDALVNNAGGQFSAPLAQISAKGWDAVVRNNLTGGFLMARECFNRHMAGHGGAIVNMLADIWMGMPGMGHSGAARAGMLNFTETAALEWAPVRVNAVAPGWIASSGMDRYPPHMRAMIRGLHRNVPLHRLGTESEVSAAIVFLLSPAAAFISGACIRIDGAAPNAKRVWPQVGSGRANAAFDGFHLARTPDVLKDA
ncbi:MAG: SDR family oxidoreductase [Betaproteobacteria bacterium]|nr:SDR family oxidoreductase [Rhodocyclaceae bacterium]MCA3135122.1 SDR family oxidoreductase [Rhodocyclaceae bacterium]MCA3143512.1 SDR family oxidoreductase [Rhodocyclaceae bacterium]MCA3145402.1 SDR family oxidoreductase [Rhodocyclaceae bacterium]MCE2896958.1 SDR family oxidoreductase [Betaproteobacteria bacterium]